MRTLAFWLWFVIAIAALVRLWSTAGDGALFARFGPADGLALVVLLVAAFVLGRVQYRTARGARR